MTLINYIKLINDSFKDLTVLKTLDILWKINRRIFCNLTFIANCAKIHLIILTAANVSAVVALHSPTPYLIMMSVVKRSRIVYCLHWQIYWSFNGLRANCSVLHRRGSWLLTAGFEWCRRIQLNSGDIRGYSVSQPPLDDIMECLLYRFTVSSWWIWEIEKSLLAAAHDRQTDTRRDKSPDGM